MGMKYVPAMALLAALSLGAADLERVWGKRVSVDRDLVHRRASATQDDAASIGLSGDDSLELIDRTHTHTGTYSRFRQRHKGIPVFGQSITLTHDIREPIRTGINDGSRSRVSVRGVLAKRFRSELRTIPALRTEDAARSVKASIAARFNRSATTIYDVRKAELVWYIDDNGEAHLAYTIDIFLDDSGRADPMRRVSIIDADTGAVLKEWDALTHARIGYGHGGNAKTGKYVYGLHYTNMDVTAVSASLCVLSNASVVTINLSNNTTGTAVFGFPYCSNWDTTVNGGYSAENDAHFFGGVVHDMFVDYIGIPPLVFTLTNRVHYGVNYENAFWNGAAMTYGDGFTRFYPLVCLDVIAHEVSHGFTEQHANLIYSGQSGGINESFSDMAGEAAKYFFYGSNDFRVGSSIFKLDGALRYMNDPSLDGRSIAHVSEFYNNIDVHYSSGVFNKAFYLLATSPGWNTRMAFTVFSHANRFYWTPSSDFFSAADDVIASAVDLGYPPAYVSNAFAAVGSLGAYVASNSATGLVYRQIQDAIDASAMNFTVYVLTNSHENVTVFGKTNMTITKGASAISLNGMGSSSNGIEIRNSSNITVCDLTSERWSRGVFVSNSSGIRVERSRLVSNMSAGISDYAGTNNRYTSNAMTGGIYGIYLSYTTIAAYVQSNHAFSNQFGMYAYGATNSIFQQNLITTNTMYGIFISSGSNNHITLNRCAVISAGIGMYLPSCYRSTVMSNTLISMQNDGIFMIGDSNRFWFNSISGQGGNSIYVPSGNYNDIRSNYVAPRNYYAKKMVLGSFATLTPWANSAIDFLGDTTAPQPVTGVGAATNTVDPTSVIITWLPSAAADFSFYRVFRSLSSSYFYLSDADIIGHTFSVGHTTYTDRPASGETYYYFVNAVDASGNESWYSSASAVVFSNGSAIVSNASSGAVYVDMQSACSSVANGQTLYLLTNVTVSSVILEGRTAVTLTKAPWLTYTPAVVGTMGYNALTLSNCSACIVRDITVRNASVGISISNTIGGGNVVQSCLLSNNNDGLMINSPENTVSGCTIASNIRYGAYVFGSATVRSNGFIENSFFGNGGYGIYLSSSVGYSNRILSNSFTSNTRACFVGASGSDIAFNAIAANTYGVVIIGNTNRIRSNHISRSAHEGINLAGISNSVIQNTCISNSIGISLMNTVIHGNSIWSNGILSNTTGITTGTGVSNDFYCNIIASNQTGISAASYMAGYSASNQFRCNMIISNYYGYYGTASITNILFDNFFANTGYNIYTSGTGRCIASNNDFGSRTFSLMRLYGSAGVYTPWRNSRIEFSHEIDAPSSPASLSAVTNVLGQVTLTWSAVASPDLSNYIVYRSTGSSLSNILDSEAVASVSGSTTYVDTPPANALYNYYVTALDTNGNEGWYSPGASVNYVSPDSPPSVSGFTLTRVPATHRVSLSCTAADSDGDLMSASIEYSESGWGNWTVIPLSELSMATNAIVNGVYWNMWTPGAIDTSKVYDVRIRMRSRALVSAYCMAMTEIDSPPTIAGVSAVAKPLEGFVEFTYSVADSENDVMSLYLEYRTGSVWVSAADNDLQFATEMSNGVRTSRWYPRGVDTALPVEVRLRVKAASRYSAYASSLTLSLGTMFSLKNDLNNVIALNNPYRSGSGIVFANLTDDAVLSIYTVSGKLIDERTLDRNTTDGAVGRIVWPVTSRNGRPAGPGVYICSVRSASLKANKVLRVMVVR